MASIATDNKDDNEDDVKESTTLLTYPVQPHLFFDFVDESHAGILKAIQDFWAEATTRLNPTMVGGLVCLIVGCAKTGKSFTLNSLVPYVLTQVKRNNIVNKFVPIDVQRLSTTNACTMLQSLHDNLAVSAHLFDARSSVSPPLLYHDVELFLEHHPELNLCLLIDEFHQLLHMPPEDRVQSLRVIKVLSGIPRVFLFISSTCMLPVLFHATQISPNGFSFSNNCRTIILPNRFPPSVYPKVCASALEFAEVQASFTPEQMALAIEKSGLAKTAATAYFVASVLIRSSPRTLEDLFAACGELTAKIADELRQECQGFLRSMPSDFRVLLLHIAEPEVCQPPTVEDFCKLFPMLPLNPMLYLKLLADDSVPLVNMQSLILGLRGYYGEYIRHAVRPDGEVIDSLSHRPDASPSILARIGECRYFLVDSALGTDCLARRALNDLLQAKCPKPLSNKSVAMQWNLFKFLWSDVKDEKRHLLTLHQEWTAAWPSQADIYVQFVGKVIGHRFAHPGMRGFDGLFRSIIRMGEFANLTSLVDTAHHFCLNWAFKASSVSYSPHPVAADLAVDIHPSLSPLS